MAVAYQPEPITREGYERLRAELRRLVGARRREADLDERDALERRIDELEHALVLSRIVEPPAGRVAGIGKRVRLRFADGAAPIEYHLVGAAETDPARGRISIGSPVGRALVGRRPGDVVEVGTPGGARSVEIIEVDHI